MSASSKEDQAAGNVVLQSEQTVAYLREIDGRNTGSSWVTRTYALWHSFISDAVRAGVLLFIAGWTQLR